MTESIDRDPNLRSPMTAEDYRHVQAYFERATSAVQDEERAAVLIEVSQERPELLSMLESMLACDDASWSDAEPGAPAQLDDLNTPSVTGLIEGYELIEELGRGGMGVVYKARQQSPHRVVALKMIRVGRFASHTEVQRFRSEVDAIAQLDHPNIVSIYEIGCYRGEHFFTMQLIEGGGFDQYLESSEFNEDEALDLFIKVCDAVACCHEQGIVHRDLKPSNILLDTECQPKLTDFGLAKHLEYDAQLTRTGDVMGTPGYMAPEQADDASSNRVGAPADVYSLGAILYHMLTGQPPINPRDVNLAGAIQLVRDNDVMAPRLINRRISRTLETICMKCLAADPNQRYPHAGEVAEELRRYVDGEPIHARPLSSTRQLIRWGRQQPGLAVTWLAVVTFYVYHLLCYYLLQRPELTPRFHLVSNFVAVLWMTGAYLFQKLLVGTRGARWVLFAWVSMEIVLLSVLLLATGQAAKSPLSPLFLVLVAASVLRFRSELVAYVTGLSLVSYLLLAALTRVAGDVPGLSLLEIVPLVLCILCIGMIQYFALRRSHSALELVSRRQRFR